MSDKVRLTATEVAREIGISVPTATKLIRSGEIRGLRIGRQYRVRPADLLDFVITNSTGNIRKPASTSEE